VNDLETIVNEPSINQLFADPPMLLRTVAAGGFFRANASFLAKVGFDQADLAAAPFLHWVDPAEVDVVTETIDGRRDSCWIGHRTCSGDTLSLDIRVVGADDDSMVLARWVEEVEVHDDPKDSEDEASVSGTLHTIARIVEDQNPGYKCSILLVADGRFVRGAGPSLPDEYNDAIDGFAIGPAVGSCGTAIFWGVPVIVENIQTDPLWVAFADLAKSAGVASCWSHPFTSKAGDVLGALALYSPVPRAPTQEQAARLEAAARLTGLAVERARAQEAFRAKRERELELEEQLRQAAKMEALGVLAGGIAHDFNNILTTVLANAEFGREILPADSEVQELLADIVEASTRAGQFCQQLLAYAGRGSLARSRIEIGALVPVVSKLVQAAVSKKTTIEYDLIEEPIHVEGDENQLVQVIMNLITNAAEAIGDNEGSIVVKSSLARYDENTLQRLDPQAGLSPGEYVRLSVIDTGSGMSPDTAARIFDPFFSTKLIGRGLGLSAVQGIVSKHGGAILIESELGIGTTFTVVLPTSAPITNAEPEAGSTSPEVVRQCILIADDEPALRSILARRLRHAGYEVLEAADGQEAVDLFTEHCDSIDCALLDLSMPKLDGEEAQQALHALRRDLPIVMMSGFSEQETVDRFSDSGVSGCLQKPCSGEVLLGAIRDAISKPA